MSDERDQTIADLRAQLAEAQAERKHWCDLAHTRTRELTEERAARQQSERERDEARAKLVAAEERRDYYLREQQTVGQLLEHTRAERDRAVAALRDLVEDLEARWDMRDPRTNPGIVHYVEAARAALRETEGP